MTKPGEDKTPLSKGLEITPPNTNQESQDPLDTEDGDAEMELEEPDLAGVDLVHLEHAYR
jgi:hypothetical protein